MIFTIHSSILLFLINFHISFAMGVQTSKPHGKGEREDGQTEEHARIASKIDALVDTKGASDKVTMSDMAYFLNRINGKEADPSFVEYCMEQCNEGDTDCLFK